MITVVLIAVAISLAGDGSKCLKTNLVWQR
jgi:hypothetical protein